MSTVTASSMTRARSGARTTASRLRMPLFYVVTLAFLAFLVAALNEPMRFVALAWTPEYGFPTHRVHHVMIGGLIALLVVGVAAGLYRPARRAGAYLLAAIAVAALTVVTVAVEGLAGLAEVAIFVVPLVLIGLLHPGLGVVRPTRAWLAGRLDVRLVALATLAAVPLIAFAAIQVNLQLTAADEHVAFEHYVFMAAGALTIAAGALVASLRPVGWRALAYGVSALLALVGVASVIWADPVQGTNFGTIGGIAAVLWAIAFVAVAEYGVRESGDRESDDRDAVGRDSDGAEQLV